MLRGIEPPNSAAEVRQLSAKIIAQVLNHRLDLKIARLVLLACRTFLQAATMESLIPCERRSAQPDTLDERHREEILAELSKSLESRSAEESRGLESG